MILAVIFSRLERLQSSKKIIAINLRRSRVNGQEPLQSLILARQPGAKV